MKSANKYRAKYADLSADPQLSEQEQCELLSAFSRIACAGSNCLQPSESSAGHWNDFSCRMCDAAKPSRREESVYWDRDSHEEPWKEVIAAMITITQEEQLQKASKPRVLLAVAIGRLFNHISDSDYLNLEISSLGEWLLKSMTRSLRELRIAASQSLMAFLRDDISKQVRDKNRRATMQFFAELTRRNVISQQETLIMAYGQAARVCSEVERQIILGQLVEYLGHTNTVIHGTAANELESLADDRNTLPRELLRPYWRTIGFSVVNELHTKPQKARFVADLTTQNKSIQELLLAIQGDVLPVLVLNKRKDVLQLIAQAKKTTIEELCSQPRRHLACILALLLCQTGKDVEKRAMEALITVAPGFRHIEQELHHLVSQEPAFAACEILELAADRDARDKEPVST